MLMDRPQVAAEAGVGVAITEGEKEDMDTAELCYESEILPSLPSAESLETQEPPLPYPESYMSHLEEREALFSSVPPPSSPSTYFQASNLNVTGSTTVPEGPWEQLPSAHGESQFGSGPSPSENASPGRCNSTEERAFVDSLCEESLKSDCLVTSRHPDPSASPSGPVMNKNVTFEALQSSANSERENEFESTLTAEEMTPADKGRGPSPSQGKDEKTPTSGLSLRNALSDPITGNPLDDAMMALCGHSFGGGSLQKLLQLRSCLNCGASVSPDTLVPNFALRTAVLAYKHEQQAWQSDTVNGTKRRRELFQELQVFGHSENRKDSASPGDNTVADSLRLKGLQFPFSVNDRVIIKGNKRTPERFFGMEAIITSQCLNGWYLVKTLKTRENVRLQYRCLQKLGETELPSNTEEQRPTKQGVAGGCVYLVSSEDLREFSSCNESASDYDLREQGAAIKSKEDKVLSDSVPMTHNSGRKSGSDALEDCEMPSVHNETPVRKVILHRVDNKYSKDGADTDGEDGILKGRSELDTVRSMSPQPEGAGATDKSSEKEHYHMRRKATGTHVRGSRGCVGFTAKSDPYRKVYKSGSQRRNANGEPTIFVKETKEVTETSVGKDLNINETAGASRLGRSRRKGPSRGGDSEILNILRRDMLKLEMQIPRKLLLHSWRSRRVEWRRLVQSSQTVSELGARVRDFRDSILLAQAGGISDEEWDMRTALVIESGDIELLVSVWGRLYDDIHKWIRSRPNVLLQDRLHKSVSLGASLGIDKHDANRKKVGLERALSSVHATTSAALAAVDAVALGQHDPDDCIKELLTSTRKLIQKQSCIELSAVREVLEREKRHITAKLAALESRFTDLDGHCSRAAPLTEPLHSSGVQHYSRSAKRSVGAGRQDLTESAKFTHPREFDTEEGDSDATMPIQVEDGEATDMSDSD